MMMRFVSSLDTGIGPVLVNHLWQSTLFVGVIWLLTLLLRKNEARVRYWLWLAASVKFLIPFSLLISLGRILAGPQRVAVVPQTSLYFFFVTAAHPFSGIDALPIHSTEHIAGFMDRFSTWMPVILVIVWLSGTVIVSLVWYLRWRQVASARRRAIPVHTGRELERLSRLACRSTPRTRIALLRSQELVEPGIFGIFRPVLLWPDRLSAHLDDENIDAILVHETMHAQRYDNLTAAIHMLVEAVFWFHPLVWWMETRLVEERERACDEAAVRLAGRPEIYAESLLKTSRFCVESPLICASGVTGADLRARIVRIMSNVDVHRLDLRRKLLLIAAALVAIAAPVAFGLIHPSQAAAAIAAPPPLPVVQSSSDTSAPAKVPEFAVASIKQNKSGSMGMMMRFAPDGLTATNILLSDLIRQAYGVNDDQVSGEPGWTSSEHFDIDAKVDSTDVPALKNLTFDQRRQMLRSLLVDRFGLKVHEETKEMPVYALVVAKGGPKMHEAKPGDTYPNGLKGPDGQHGGAGMMMFNANGQLTAQGASIETLTRILSRQLGRTVLDKTGLTAKYDFTLQMPSLRGLVPMPHSADGGPPSADSSADDSSGPSIFTALQDQLGLKLESQKAPLPLIVVDHIEQPSAN
jgi:bla regulator protein blaR1